MWLLQHTVLWLRVQAAAHEDWSEGGWLQALGEWRKAARRQHYVVGFRLCFGSVSNVSEGDLLGVLLQCSNRIAVVSAPFGILARQQLQPCNSPPPLALQTSRTTTQPPAAAACCPLCIWFAAACKQLSAVPVMSCDGCMLQIVTVPLFRMLPFNFFSSRQAGKARRHCMLLRKS